MTAIFGTDIKEVLADKRENSVTFTARYETFNVLGTFVEHSNYYSASVYGSKGCRTEKLVVTPLSFCHEMDDMLSLLTGNEMKKTYEEFIFPVYIMNALARSLESGKWEAPKKQEL